jgi:hypothetical protein
MSGSLARLVLRAQGQLPVAEPLLPSRFAPVEPTLATINPLETEAGWSEPGADPAAASPNRDTPPAHRVKRTPPSPAVSQVQRAPMSEDTTAAGTGPAAPLSLSRRNVAPSPVNGVAAAFADEASVDVSPEWGLASPPIIAVYGAAAETPELIAGPQGLRPRPSAPRARIGTESLPLAPRHLTEAELGQLPPGLRTEVEPRQPANRRPPPGPFVPVSAEVPGGARAMPPALSGVSVSPRVPDVHISIGRVEVHAGPARAAPVRATPARRPPLSLADYLAQRK